MIELTHHAQRKIRQRDLRKAWVQETLRNPEFTVSSYRDRKIAYKRIGKLYLAVVFVEEEKNLVVITAHWEEGFKPPKEV